MLRPVSSLCFREKIKIKHIRQHTPDRICPLFIMLISEASLWYNPERIVQLSVLTKHCCLHQHHIISCYQRVFCGSVATVVRALNHLSRRHEFNMLMCGEESSMMAVRGRRGLTFSKMYYTAGTRLSSAKKKGERNVSDEHSAATGKVIISGAACKG